MATLAKLLVGSAACYLVVSGGFLLWLRLVEENDE